MTAPQPLIAADDALVELIDALQVLTARQRAVIVLRYVEMLSESEIANAIGCRPGTVKSLLARAHVKLRKELYLE